MKVKVYTIRDTVSGIHADPFTSINDDTAKRILSYVIRDTETDIAKAPKDYELWSVAEFDNELGIIDTNELASFICNLSTII